MPRESRRRGAPASPSDPPSRASTPSSYSWIALISGLVVLLSQANYGLGYFWDDFYFLRTSGPGSWTTHLLPEGGAPFYRPIPLGLYFGFLRWLDPASGWLGHAVNAAVLIATIVFLAK